MPVCVCALALACITLRIPAFGSGSILACTLKLMPEPQRPVFLDNNYVFFACYLADVCLPSFPFLLLVFWCPYFFHVVALTSDRES